MGAKAKAQRPKKRKGAPREQVDEAPHPRLRRKETKSREAEADWEGSPPAEDTKDKQRREELVALEMLLFGTPTAPEEDTQLREAAAPADPEASTDAGVAAWVDPHDAKLRIDIDADPKLRKLKMRKAEKYLSGEEYQRRLQALHHKLIGKGQGLDWIQQARLRKQQSRVEGQVDEGELTGFRHTGQEAALASGERLVVASDRRRLGRKQRAVSLPPTRITMRRLEDANKQDVSLCPVSALEFHPTSNILLTAGRDKSLRLFLVDGNKNCRLECVHVKGFPIVSASFSVYNGGRTVMLLSNACKTIAEYDLEQGQLYQVPGIGGRREERCYHQLCMSPLASSCPASPVVNTFAVANATSQSVLLCDANTKRLLEVFQMNAPVVGMAYHPHRPTSLLTADADAAVYEWELRTGRCLGKLQDPAYVGLTSFAVSPQPHEAYSYNRPSSILALGSRSGYTDLFTVPKEGSPSGPAFKVPPSPFIPLSPPLPAHTPRGLCSDLATQHVCGKDVLCRQRGLGKSDDRRFHITFSPIQ
ncbi:utp18 u3 snoRNA-associated related protein [Cyclospora cayetanensis]|uniref:Utp18 u3 snoRNA-associated related protein n=1 Tax=Cyclospora cayetanensis TaxID=88456 RepID=A0A1D3CV44_9EIME|nr:utp18 u3 snoRNA-associated related protein [Cyclospora cayetanensis]